MVVDQEPPKEVHHRHGGRCKDQLAQQSILFFFCHVFRIATFSIKKKNATQPAVFVIDKRQVFAVSGIKTAKMRLKTHTARLRNFNT